MPRKKNKKKEKEILEDDDQFAPVSVSDMEEEKDDLEDINIDRQIENEDHNPFRRV